MNIPVSQVLALPAQLPVQVKAAAEPFVRCEADAAGERPHHDRNRCHRSAGPSRHEPRDFNLIPGGETVL